MTELKMTRASRPDAQAFDEIRIVTVPRYKMSALSGDEWRISARIDFMRNGIVRHSDSYRDVETAVRFLDSAMMKANDEGLASYANDLDDLYCDQEGCSETATVTYKLKQRHCRSCGHGREAGYQILRESIEVRKFCARHSRRGDCGLDDADANYELIEGIVGMPDEKDMSPSQQVTVKVNSLEDIPNAIQQIHRERQK